MTRTMSVLLGVIAVAVVAIAVLLSFSTFAGNDEPKQDPARVAAEEKARKSAEYFCTFEGVVPGMTGLDDPKYLNCVKRETKDEMEQWDAPH